MIVTGEKLKSRGQTGRQVYRLASTYWPDLDDFGLLDLTLKAFFDKVRKIPYTNDPQGTEYAIRPGFLLDRRMWPALDCKKKAILIATYLEAHGWKPADGRRGEKLYRLVAVSEKPSKEIHHLYVQAFINGKWRNIDPTYETYRIFEPKPHVTFAQELLP